jgi:hypothetical protein
MSLQLKFMDPPPQKKKNILALLKVWTLIWRTATVAVGGIFTQSRISAIFGLRLAFKFMVELEEGYLVH